MLKPFSLKLLPAIIFISIISAVAQDSSSDRGMYRNMLKTFKSEIEKKYYDDKYKNIDLNAHFAKYDAMLKQAASNGQMIAIVAQSLIDFDDSHLFFLPPMKVNRYQYGFEMRMVGEKCLITDIEDDSNAKTQGIGLGDEIYSLEGFIPSRSDFWKMQYFYGALLPRETLNLILVKPNGKKYQYEVKAKVFKGKSVVGTNVDDWKQFEWKLDKENGDRKYIQYVTANKSFIWRMPEFYQSPDEIDRVMEKVGKQENLILDLRGNGGGRVDGLKRLLGYFFANDVKIGDRQTRKGKEEETAKAIGKNPFSGKLIVLIDSESGSASEVFARTIQIEKRGIVLGDQSAGAVMEALRTPHKDGIDYVAYYGMSVTVADLIMKDGSRLEKVGVVPDEKILPTAQDLAEKRDPVLSRALKMVGIEQTPAQAGKFYLEDKSK